jgi:hypothetical protein
MAPVPREGTGAVGSLLSGAPSWLVVVTVRLSPMLVYWLARLIGQALHRKAPGPSAGNPSAEEGERGPFVMDILLDDRVALPVHLLVDRGFAVIAVRARRNGRRGRRAGNGDGRRRRMMILPAAVPLQLPHFTDRTACPSVLKHGRAYQNYGR